MLTLAHTNIDKHRRVFIKIRNRLWHCSGAKSWVTAVPPLHIEWRKG